MGFETFRRPIRTAGLLASTGTSTRGAADVGSDIAGGLKLPVETITLAAADQTISRNGVSFVTYGTSGLANDAILQAPDESGQVKFIFLVNNTTSVEAAIHTNATANTFWGTTYNTATISAASTGSPGGTPGGTPALALVAASTTQWALFPGTTFNWDLSASTGSTGIA